MLFGWRPEAFVFAKEATDHGPSFLCWGLLLADAFLQRTILRVSFPAKPSSGKERRHEMSVSEALFLDPLHEANRVFLALRGDAKGSGTQEDPYDAGLRNYSALSVSSITKN